MNEVYEEHEIATSKAANKVHDLDEVIKIALHSTQNTV